MRDLVVQLNVFDGLAHNSDDVMKNLIEQETRDTTPNKADIVFRKKQQERQVKRLMDAKELDSPVEVYKRIQDTLHESGDAIKFREWISKMRRQPDYRKNDPQLTRKLFTIYLRKAVMPARAEINTMRDKLSSELKVFDSGWNSYAFGQLVSDFSVAWSEAKIIANEFEEHVGMFLAHYPDLPDTQTVATHTINQVVKKAEEIIVRLNSVMNILERSDADPQTPEDQKRALGLCKEALSLLNHFSYLLDSI